MLEHLLIKWE